MENEESDADPDILSRFQRYHLPAFFAGVTLILFLIVLNRGMQSSLGLAVVGEEIVTPIRITLIGLGTGYYLGASVRQNNSDIIAFHVGAFTSLLALTLLSIQIHQTGWVLATAVLFSFSMNVSTLVEAYPDIGNAFDALARDLSRTGLIAVVIIQYGVSIYIWSGEKLASYTFLEKVIILVASFALIYGSYLVSNHITEWQKSSEETESGEDGE